MTRKYRSQGRFGEKLDLLVRMISDRHVVSSRRAKKLLGLVLSDPRMIAKMMEFVNNFMTGRGDGLTLLDVSENVEVKRVLKRDKKRSFKDVEKK